jgi:predicted lipid-binding transport protein (Tim44 family)
MSNDRVAEIMNISRWLAALAAVILIIPVMADARVGGGTSSGSRGSNTGAAPAPTKTAPSAAPIERSATPTQSAKPATNVAQAAPAAQGGFFSRNPILGGMMGGFLGAGLFGMMFGGGFGGMSGMSGMFGLILQLALIGGLAYLAVRLWRGRTASAAASPQSAYAGATQRLMEPPLTRDSSVPLTGGGSGAPVNAPIAITTEDYSAFENLLGGIQSAYSAGDLSKLRALVTPEMLGYFSEQLSGNASRGIENKVEAVKLEQGDLSEAWSEANLDYATVAMRFSLIDYSRRLGDGAIVEGNAQARTEATEIWTFARSHGGHWILSAIQQAA